MINWYDRSFDHTMARISRHPLEKDAYKQVLDTLDLVLGKMKKDEVRSFLFSLLGKNERIMLSKRFAAALLLSRGMSVSQVSKTLKITKQTVIRILMSMKIKNQGFDLAVRKINKDKMVKEINKMLLGLGKEAADVFMNWRIKPPNDYPR